MLQKITLLLGIAVWAFCSTLTAQQDLPPSADNSKAINLKLSDRTFSPASAPAPVQMNLGDSSAVQVNLNDDSTPVTTNQNKPSSPVQMNLSDGTSSRYPSPRSPTVYSQTVNGLPTPGPASMRRGQQSGISYRLQDSMPNLQANAAEKEAIDKSTRQFPTPDFLDPNQYLPESPAMVEHHFLNPNRFLKAKVASTIPSVPTFPKARPIRQEGDDERYDELFQVAPVDSPLSPAPFADIAQESLADTPVQIELLEFPVSYASFTGAPAYQSTKLWTAPNFFHSPLYFEDINLERYGNTKPCQSLHSAAHFYGSIALMPYKIAARGRECVFTNHHDRPGNCVPSYQYRQPISNRGLLMQALLTCAIVIP